MHSTSTPEPRERRHPARFRATAAGVAFALLVLGATPAVADEYQSKFAGHPLRIAAYVVHPIGVIFETLFLRPGHWLVHRSSLKGLFGHTD